MPKNYEGKDFQFVFLDDRWPPMLLTYQPRALPFKHQIIATCARCGALNRWDAPCRFISYDTGNFYMSLFELRQQEPELCALTVFIDDNDFISHMHSTPNSPVRCYYCRELFSPEWRWEPSEPYSETYERRMRLKG